MSLSQLVVTLSFVGCARVVNPFDVAASPPDSTTEGRGVDAGSSADAAAPSALFDAPDAMPDAPAIDVARHSDATADAAETAIECPTAGDFVITDIGALLPEWLGSIRHPSSNATSINDLGQVVGTASQGTRSVATTIAWRWDGGGMPHLLRGDDFRAASAADVNNAGVVVGRGICAGCDVGGSWPERWGAPPPESSLFTFRERLDGHAIAINAAGHIIGSRGGAFLFRDGRREDLVVPDGGGFSPSDIDDRDRIVGTARFGDGPFVAAMWDHGTVASLGTLDGASSSQAVAINAVGEIVGTCDTADGEIRHACLWRDGMVIDLGTPGGNATAKGINASGSIVGTYERTATSARAFIVERGVMSDLNDRLDPRADTVILEANAINSTGQIVGRGLRRGGDSSHAVLLTPVERVGCVRHTDR